ncbi:LIC_13346 family putative lipoprotein [Leptospira wolffii]|uniref:LIC_13346 family putative lipoprotein n=1 Tax=Leptospira wolffii TaxID=409998 RepID=UPI001FF04890|nr:hypothetical protein [Leptospira wolffii]
MKIRLKTGSFSGNPLFSGWINLNQKFRSEYFPYFLIWIAVLTFSIGSCSSLSELAQRFTEDKSPFENLPNTRVYWNLSPGAQSSESFRSLPGHLRYLVIHILPNKEKIWQGEVDLWEAKDEFLSSLPKGIYFPRLSFKAAILTGSTQLGETDSPLSKKVSFFPSLHSFWEWEGDSFSSGMKQMLSRNASVADWNLIFDFQSDGIAWVSKETRSVGAGYKLQWENIRNRGTSLSTDFHHPSGRSFPFADYDYRNQIFRFLPLQEASIPVWVFKKEGDLRLAWSLLPEELVANAFSKRKQTGKSELSGALFYDLANNNPFTARADLKDYPIILLKDEDNARK